MRGQQNSKGSGGEGESGGVTAGAAAQQVRRERAEEKAGGSERQRQPEERQRLRVQVEEVAHAHRVVAGILLQQRGQVGVWRGRARVQQEVDRGRGKDPAEREQHGGAAERGLAGGHVIMTVHSRIARLPLLSAEFFGCDIAASTRPYFDSEILNPDQREPQPVREQQAECG